MAAIEAALRGDWLRCADSYARSYNVLSREWDLLYNCISGYTSVLAENHFQPRPEDMQLLEDIAKDENAPPLHRSKAAVTRGLMHWLKNGRELGAKKTPERSEAVKGQKDLQNVLVFLRSHGLGAGLAARIVKRYGANASALVEANPYRLADDVIGVGFRIADRLAGQMGIEPTAPERLDAALEFALSQAAREGHCYLPEEVLVRRTSDLLSCAEEPLKARLPELARAGRIARQLPPGPTLLLDDPQPVVYPAALVTAEDGVSRTLDALVRSEADALPVHPESAVKWFSQVSGMELASAQTAAIVRALSEPVSVITGGPGVGKTTIVRALVQILEQKNLKLVLAAPTGRAPPTRARPAGPRPAPRRPWAAAMRPSTLALHSTGVEAGGGGRYYLAWALGVFACQA